VKLLDSILINWEIEIMHANYGEFSVSESRNQFLSYRQQNEDGFYAKSKIIAIDDGVITEIFENRLYLGKPAVDRNGFIYVCTNDAIRDGKVARSTLLKLNPEGIVVFKYQLVTGDATNPVIYQDSVLVFDFNGEAVGFRAVYPQVNAVKARLQIESYLKSEDCANLYRISENGTLIWKKPFSGSTMWGPYLFKMKGQDAILLQVWDELFILDMYGNILCKKTIGRPINGLYADTEGDIFAGLYPNKFLHLNTNLDMIWTYRPETGFVASQPGVDSHSHLYCMMQGRRIVSLDSVGKERWIAGVTGDVGKRPIVLANGDILIVTEQKSGKKAPEIEDNTYLEIFSPNGTKLQKHEFPGGGADAFMGNDGTIFLITHCRRAFPRKQRALNSIKIFSLTIY
jgi:outer membrane protein assembly factor BamB